MNCKEYQQQAIEVAFGEAERTGEFDRHLESCVACREEYAVYEFAAKGIEDVPAPPAPSLSNERLYSAIRAQNIRRSSPWLPRLAFAGAAASLALVAWLGFNRPTSEPELPVIASADKPLDGAPRGPIEIPEKTPILDTAAPDEPTVTASSDRQNRSVTKLRPRRRAADPIIVSEVPEELLAVVVGGAEGALDIDAASFDLTGTPMMAPAPEAMRAPAENPIVVIQPQGQATEKSSDDVSIGG